MDTWMVKGWWWFNGFFNLAVPFSSGGRCLSPHGRWDGVLSRLRRSSILRRTVLSGVLETDGHPGVLPQWTLRWVRDHSQLNLVVYPCPTSPD